MGPGEPSLCTDTIRRVKGCSRKSSPSARTLPCSERRGVTLGARSQRLLLGFVDDFVIRFDDVVLLACARSSACPRAGARLAPWRSTAPAPPAAPPPPVAPPSAPPPCGLPCDCA